jgi:phage terminase large subunit-like protein
MRISPPDFKPLYEPSKRRLTWPNGVTATTFSGDEPDQLRGPQHRSVLIDELPKFAEPENLYTHMDMGLRIGEDAACVISTTPLPIKIIKELYLKALEPDSSIVITTGSTLDNAANLGKQSVASMIDRYKGTRMERQELYGEILWESELALFRSSDIDKYRVEEHPELKRIVIAVDPATSTSTSSDNTGIIVAGVGFNNEMYVLADRTMKGTPQQWASKVGELYHFYNADIIVAEKNQGGDMVMTTLQSFGGNLPVKLVTATKGKLLRAEGPSLLFEQGKIHMVGNFPELEQQMVVYDGTQKKSPDNLDAFVWAATELMLGKRAFPAKTFEFNI